MASVPEGILGNVVFAAALCLIGGITTASQGPFNSKLGQYTGQGLSSTIVFCIGAMTSIIYFLIEVKGKPDPNLLIKMGGAPWWSWLGGMIGAFYVIVTILSIPKLGVGTTTAIIVCAQLLFSCVIDHFSLFNIPFRQFTIWRGLGAAGLIGCVGVISKF